MDLKAHLENLNITPKKSSTADGGEYSSACPSCGDGGKGARSDRFRIWPEKVNKGGLCKGRFWCRRCDVSGDSIEFMQKFYNMDFLGACEALGIDLPRKSSGYKRYQSPPVMENSKGWIPRDYPLPDSIWQEKGGNLLVDCIERLASTPDALQFLAGRGISKMVASQYKLGFNLSSKGKDRYRPRSVWGLSAKAGGKKKTLWIPRGYVIPCFRNNQLIQLRIRRLNADIKNFAPEIKYLPLDGSSMSTMVLNPKADIFAIVECGFDAILIASLFGGRLGVITTWNSSARPDVYAHQLLSNSSFIINLLDFDAGGDDQQQWWTNQYPQNFRPQPPSAGADPGEMFEHGIDIRSWILSVVPRGVQIRLGNVGPKPTIKHVAKQEAQWAQNQQSSLHNSVVDVTLSNDFVIKLTDNKQEYDRLLLQGEPVFTSHEIARLKEATAKMTDQERIDFAMLAVQTKTVFGGQISRGEHE